MLPFVLTLPVFAGTTAKEVIAPAPNPCLLSWFAGGSVGYLTEFEEPLYSIHFGVTDSCWNIAGWNIALYAEVGYTQKDKTDRFNGLIDDEITRFKLDTDLQIVPITANIKFEHQITGNLNAYIGGGLGGAWISANETLNGPNGSRDRTDTYWVFTSQISAGLSYNVTQACEIYGGARWMYLNSPNLFGESVTIDNNQWLFELGVRYKF